MKNTKKLKYYSLDNILSKDCQYNVIFGERSNGKTFACFDYGLRKYCNEGRKMAIIRRWRDDFIGKRGATMFDAIVSEGLVSKYTNGEWDRIHYNSSRWYLAKFDEKLQKIITKDEPFAYAFAISTMEHDKSTSYPDIDTVVFDEFLTRDRYLPDEFVLFMNVLSTIIRQRIGIRIFMLGNTVNQYSPYFKEMGLSNIKQMKQGDIDVYMYGESGLRVAVEYADMPSKSKPSDIYFAFNNPKLNMIKGGSWEIDIYPHKPIQFEKHHIVFTYFILFEGETLQCEVVVKDGYYFTFIHQKTTPLKDVEHDIIFSQEHSHRPNWRRKLSKPTDEIGKTLYSFFTKEKVFYQDNEVGEIVRNYFEWSNRS